MDINAIALELVHRASLQRNRKERDDVPSVHAVRFELSHTNVGVRQVP